MANGSEVEQRYTVRSMPSLDGRRPLRYERCILRHDGNTERCRDSSRAAKAAPLTTATMPESTTDNTAAPATKAPQIEESWRAALEAEFGKEYMVQLRQFLISEQQAGHAVYPRMTQVFAAFAATPLPQVRVVILGQDPYHGPGQAMGLSFSVPDGIAVPPSLQNIYKELQADLGVATPPSGDLTRWAQQGVLLLNAMLTVRAGQAASHRGRGWEQFTDAVLRTVSGHCDHVVFILWGNYARSKATLIDQSKHLVLQAAHPSPLSAHSGFFGSRPFSRANAWLREQGRGEVGW